MNFDYYTLKKLAKESSRIGNWNGKAVFVTSAAQLQNLGSGAFFMLYDDDNKIVARDGEYFYSYGIVSQNGTINEYDGRRKYSAVEREARSNSSKLMSISTPVLAAATYAPGNVEDVLKSAREISVRGLLEGFLTNVNFEIKG